MKPPTLQIRPLARSDSLVDLTALLHRAYASLGDMGLNYTAVDQTPEVAKPLSVEPAAPIERDAVRAILLTPAREVLLLRIVLPTVPEGFWIAPGGGLQPGENVEDALRRELREEVGLDRCVPGPPVWRRQHTFNWAGQRICQREEYYIVHTDRFEPIMSDAHEAEVLDGFRWWSLAELADTRERLTPLSLPEIIRRHLTDGPPSELPPVEVLVD